MGLAPQNIPTLIIIAVMIAAVVTLAVIGFGALMLLWWGAT